MLSSNLKEKHTHRHEQLHNVWANLAVLYENMWWNIGWRFEFVGTCSGPVKAILSILLVLLKIRMVGQLSNVKVALARFCHFLHYLQAVCCSDKKHCCPHGYNCSTGGKCEKAGSIIDWLEKLPSIGARETSNRGAEKVPAKDKSSVGNVTCKDKKTNCPESSGFCCEFSDPSSNTASSLCCPYHKVRLDYINIKY